jgi:hypothetical protein
MTSDRYRISLYQCIEAGAASLAWSRSRNASYEKKPLNCRIQEKEYESDPQPHKFVFI